MYIIFSAVTNNNTMTTLTQKCVGTFNYPMQLILRERITVSKQVSMSEAF